MEELMNKATTFMLPQAVGIIWQDILGWNGQKWENVSFSASYSLL